MHLYPRIYAYINTHMHAWFIQVCAYAHTHIYIFFEICILKDPKTFVSEYISPKEIKPKIKPKKEKAENRRSAREEYVMTIQPTTEVFPSSYTHMNVYTNKNIYTYIHWLPKGYQYFFSLSKHA